MSQRSSSHIDDFASELRHTPIYSAYPYLMMGLDKSEPFEQSESELEASSHSAASPPHPSPASTLPPPDCQSPYLRQTAWVRAANPQRVPYHTSSTRPPSPASAHYHLADHRHSPTCPLKLLTSTLDNTSWITIQEPELVRCLSSAVRDGRIRSDLKEEMLYKISQAIKRLSHATVRVEANVIQARRASQRLCCWCMAIGVMILSLVFILSVMIVFRGMENLRISNEIGMRGPSTMKDGRKGKIESQPREEVEGDQNKKKRMTKNYGVARKYVGIHPKCAKCGLHHSGNFPRRRLVYMHG
nr:hypothetical protein [Tanacetum cinerariifolium]